MAVHVDIIAELQERKVKQAADRLHREFDSINVEIGADVKAAEIKAAAARIQREFSDIRAEIKVDVDHSTIGTLDQVGTRLRNLSSGAEQAHRNLMKLGTTVVRTARGLGALGAAPAIMVLADFAKVAATATQSLWLLPAAATAAGAGIGTLKLATMGFGDAMDNIGDPEKFAEALQSLSPNAQQAALSIQALLPELKGLKNATQDAFSDDLGGIGGIIEKLTNTYLPSVQEMTTGIADSFNQMIKDVGNQLLTPATQGQLQGIMANITQGFQNAAPAAQAFAQAFIDITEVGSEFLPGFGTGIADLAQNFADFIREAKQSGQLREDIQEGIEAVKSLADGIWELMQIGKELYDFFTAGSGIEDFKDDMQGLHDITAIVTGDFHVFGADIRSEFEQTTGAARAFVNFWLDIPEALATATNKIIDMVNGVKHAIENMARNAQQFLAFLNPFGGAGPAFEPLPDIPHVPAGGDWGQIGGPTFPTGPNRAIPNRSGLGPGQDPALSQLPGAPAGRRPVPAAPAKGPKQSDKDRRDAIKAGLDPSLYRVDPFAALPGMPPNMSPIGGATGPGMYGPGIGTVDPVAVQEALFGVETKAHELEESRKDRLALERDSNATAEEISDAKWKEHQDEIDLWKSQQDLLEKQRGTVKKFTDSFDEFGAALDKDFGISKGLPGIAENLVKFLGNLAFAPMMGQLEAIKQANPSKGGYGLIGMAGAQGAFGDRFTGIDPYANATTGGPTSASQYGLSGGIPNVGMPSILKDTGSVSSGPQSRYAASLIQQLFGGQLRGPIGGSRDTNTAKGTHDAGLSIDIPIGSDQGELGDQINAFLQQNAGALGLKYSIWRDRGTYPGGGGFAQPGHQDHIDAHFNGSAGTPTAPGNYGPGIAPPLQGNFGAEGWRSTVASVVDQYSSQMGITPENRESWINAIVSQIGTESSGNPNAQNPNDSNGQGGSQSVSGLLQYLPSSYNMSGGKLTGRPFMDPIGQIAGALFAPRTASGAPDTSAPGGIGAGHGWGPVSTPISGGGWAGPGLPAGLTGGAGQSPIFGTNGPGMVGRGAGQGLGENYGGAGGGSWNANPGIGSAAGTRIGGLAPPAPNPGGGGVGMTPGGTLDTAMGIAASGLDLLAPGAGQAAQVGIKLASRAIQYAGQAAGIGVSGLMETFLPTGGSQLANNNWLTRIAGGIAGAAPALPNIAGGVLGQQQMQGGPVKPGDVSSGQGQGPPPGPGINVEYHNHNAQPDRAHADIADRLGQMAYAQPAVR